MYADRADHSSNDLWRIAELHFVTAEAAFRRGNLRDADIHVREGLALRSRSIDGCRLLVAISERQGHPTASGEPWCALGDALFAADQVDGAAIAYRTCLGRQVDHLGALIGLALCYQHQNEPERGVPLLERALLADPQNIAIRRHHAEAHAALGNVEQLWRTDLWCVDRTPPWRRFAQPLWDGKSPKVKTILIWQNAGIGDSIQLLRFLPQVKALGAHVLVECDRVLIPMLRRLPFVDATLPRYTAPPSFDVHTRFAALPALLHVRFADLPNEIPYLSADPKLAGTWRKRLGRDDRKIVGLVWGGHPNPVDARRRFAPLQAFGALADLAGVRYVSLQLGPQSAELTEQPAEFRVETILREGDTLDVTAAIVENLDLVISVDTMIVHLAGALGTPVWTLLSYAADARWLIGRDRSPWYPTMRLFRQTVRGDWSNVMTQVRAALQTFVSSGDAALRPSRVSESISRS